MLSPHLLCFYICLTLVMIMPFINGKFVSKGQLALYNDIKRLYADALLNMPINAGIHTYNADIVIPSKRIIIEYDGTYWHTENASHDAVKDAYLVTQGWRIVHITDIEYKRSGLNTIMAQLQR